jgi:hypothetical protein
MPGMNAIKVETTIGEELAQLLPALRPLLGKRVELTVLEADAPALRRRKVSVDELLAARIVPPRGVGRVSVEDMERATVEGALGLGALC